MRHGVRPLSPGDPKAVDFVPGITRDVTGLSHNDAGDLEMPWEWTQTSVPTCYLLPAGREHLVGVADGVVTSYR
jgi:hypothetical protein